MNWSGNKKGQVLYWIIAFEWTGCLVGNVPCLSCELCHDRLGVEEIQARVKRCKTIGSSSGIVIVIVIVIAFFIWR